MESINIQGITNSLRSFESSFLSFIGSARIFGFVIAVIAFITVIYLLVKIFDLRDEYKDDFDEHFLNSRKQIANPRIERWSQVSEAIRSDQEGLWRMAIIEADTMLEELVSSIGYQGDTFGEKLKQVNRGDAPWLDAAWEVHRLRNILAHEGSRYALNHREAYRAYKIYENILHDSGYFA